MVFSFPEDRDQKFMFGVNVKDVRISATGESLTIKTGPTASNNFSYKELYVHLFLLKFWILQSSSVSESTDYWTRREAKGNFMQISYDGWDRNSMAVVSFDMKQINFKKSELTISMIIVICFYLKFSNFIYS